MFVVFCDPCCVLTVQGCDFCECSLLTVSSRLPLLIGYFFIMGLPVPAIPAPPPHAEGSRILCQGVGQRASAN